MECNFENCPNFERLGKKFADRISELEAENELIKTQYNCYACGNCKGKEDYINLEKHHKGLRKQFDKKVQTLQEIKKYIAKICKEDCGYIEKKRCLDCDCRFGAILDLITKAEEE